MLFPDHTDDKKLNGLLQRMLVYNPVPNQPALGGGYRNLTLRSVIEDANFRDSAHSYFVQAVDVSAYLLYQHLAPSSYMRKKSGQNYFRRLDPIVCKVITQQPGGVVMGGLSPSPPGNTFFPKGPVFYFRKEYRRQ